MQITENFSKHEFETAPSASRLHLPADVNHIPNDKLPHIIELATNLQALRDEIGLPITILSSYRSPEYNQKVGGVKNSMHMQGKAADIVIAGLPLPTLHNVIEKLIKIGVMKQGGLGLYKSFIHYDVRGTRARWHK